MNWMEMTLAEIEALPMLDYDVRWGQCYARVRCEDGYPQRLIVWPGRSSWTAYCESCDRLLNSSRYLPAVRDVSEDAP